MFSVTAPDVGIKILAGNKRIFETLRAVCRPPQRVLCVTELKIQPKSGLRAHKKETVFAPVPGGLRLATKSMTRDRYAIFERNCRILRCALRGQGHVARGFAPILGPWGFQF